MNLTRLSLYYPVSYLLGAGSGLILSPGACLKLFLSNGDYGPVLPRLAGILIVGLGILVLQIIRHRVTALYPTVVWIRVFFCAGWLSLYFFSRDPFFLFLLGVVGFGTVLSTIAYRVDKARGQ